MTKNARCAGHIQKCEIKKHPCQIITSSDQNIHRFRTKKEEAAQTSNTSKNSRGAQGILDSQHLSAGWQSRGGRPVFAGSRPTRLWLQILIIAIGEGPGVPDLAQGVGRPTTESSKTSRCARMSPIGDGASGNFADSSFKVEQDAGRKTFAAAANQEVACAKNTNYYACAHH